MNKSIWLARLLYRHSNGLTRAEILDAWADEDDRGRPMATSTFFDNRRYLETRFGLRVELCDGRYRIVPDMPDGEALLRQLAGETDANEPAAERQPGDEWLPTLGEAVKSCRRVALTYASLDHPAYQTHLDPYFVRHIHDHNYVVGYSSHHATVRTFALDRILALDLTATPFHRPPGIAATYWFSLSFGAFGGPNLRAEHVVLEVLTPRIAAYLRQRPLHNSQREATAGSRTRFHLDLAVTPDFVGELLKFGADLRIVAPDALRHRVADEARTILRLCQDADSAAPR